jgi:hypothetical protein
MSLLKIPPRNYHKQQWNLWNPENPDDTLGVVDFAMKIGNTMFCIMDTVGHNYGNKNQLDKKIQVLEIWDKFREIVEDGLTCNKLVSECVVDALKTIHVDFETVGKTSTFSCVYFTKQGMFTKTITATVVHLADSAIFHYSPAAQGLEQVTTLDKPFKDSELGSTISNIQVREFTVQSGDVIFGITDGVFENIGRKKRAHHDLDIYLPVLTKVVESSLTRKKNQMKTLSKKLKKRTTNDSQKFLKDKQLSESELDDCAFFGVIVP